MSVNQAKALLELLPWNAPQNAKPEVSEKPIPAQGKSGNTEIVLDELYDAVRKRMKSEIV